MSHSGYLQRYICRTCKSALRKPPNIANVPRRHIGTSEAAPERQATVHHALRRTQSHDQLETPDQWTAQLPARSLGVPSEVLVLRDPERRRRGEMRRSRPTQDVSEDDQKYITTDDILASMQSERKAPGQEEVNNHLDTLRPPPLRDDQDGENLLSQAAYSELFATIFNGFTLVQLSRYLAISQGSRIVEDRSNATEPASGSPFFRSRWTALSIHGSAHDATVSKDSKSRKHLVVEKILRMLWNVQIYGEQNIEGSVNLRMQKDMLELFIIGAKSSLLSQIGKKASVRLDAFRSEGIVTITGTKSRCDMAIKDMESTAAGYHETSFMLNDSSRRILSIGSPTMAALSRGTHSLFSISKQTKTELLIRSLKKSSSEKARRMLLALTTRSGRTERRLAEGVPAKNPTDVVVFAPALDSPGISFPDRFLRLGRSVFRSSIRDADVPASQKSRLAPGREGTERIVAKVLKELGGKTGVNAPTIESSSQRTHLSDSSDRAGWQSFPRITTRCNIGQILHPEPRPSRKSKARDGSPTYKFSLETSRIPKLSWPFVFDYHTPTGSSLVQLLFPRMDADHSASAEDQYAEMAPREGSMTLQLGEAGINRESSHAFCISFVSSEAAADRNRDVHPDLELWLQIDPTTQRLEASRLIANIHRQEIGVFFPGLHADLLFTRNTQLINNHPAKQTSIDSFIQELQTGIDGFGEVSPPPRLSVQLPTSIIEPHTSPRAQERDTPTQQVPAIVAVDYEVIGVRYHECLTQPYDEYQLSWDYHEAGEMGGRCEELYLQMDDDSSDASRDTMAETQVYDGDQEQHDGRRIALSNQQASGKDIGENEAMDSHEEASTTPPAWLDVARFVRSTVRLLGSIQKSIG